jgi:outer membrane biogenesis lipoprotein LolB
VIRESLKVSQSQQKSYAVNYLEWSNISWSQLPINLEPVGSSHRGNIKVDEIISFE